VFLTNLGIFQRWEWGASSWCKACNETAG